MADRLPLVARSFGRDTMLADLLRILILLPAMTMVISSLALLSVVALPVLTAVAMIKTVATTKAPLGPEPPSAADTETINTATVTTQLQPGIADTAESEATAASTPRTLRTDTTTTSSPAPLPAAAEATTMTAPGTLQAATTAGTMSSSTAGVTTQPAATTESTPQPATMIASSSPNPLPATTTAASKVLGTYELLEQILLQLPMKKLFVAQRVSSEWKAMVSRSKPLQQMMFLQAKGAAIPPGPVAAGVSSGPSTPTYCWSSFQLNPALEQRCGDHKFPYQKREGKPSSPLPLTRAGELTFEKTKNQLKEDSTDVVVKWGTRWRKASCDRMLITQPPITTLRLTVYTEELAEVRWAEYDGETYDESHGSEAFNANGITLGDLVKKGRFEKQRLEKDGRDVKRREDFRMCLDYANLSPHYKAWLTTFVERLRCSNCQVLSLGIDLARGRYKR